MPFQCTCEKCGNPFLVKTRERFSSAKFCSRDCCARAKKQVPMSIRFWRHVDKSGGPDSCWIWTGWKNNNGYGCTGGGGRNGGNVLAHRASWEMENGPIPDGLFCCHRCDVRVCVNPSHLFLGNAKDNLSDMASKGRSCRGEKNARSKLTEDQVLEIDRSKGTAREVAERYGISPAYVYSLKRRDRWKHLVPKG